MRLHENGGPPGPLRCTNAVAAAIKVKLAAATTTRTTTKRRTAPHLGVARFHRIRHPLWIEGCRSSLLLFSHQACKRVHVRPLPLSLFLSLFLSPTALWARPLLKSIQIQAIWQRGKRPSLKRPALCGTYGEMEGIARESVIARWKRDSLSAASSARCNPPRESVRSITTTTTTTTTTTSDIPNFPQICDGRSSF